MYDRKEIAQKEGIKLMTREEIEAAGYNYSLWKLYANWANDLEYFISDDDIIYCIDNDIDTDMLDYLYHNIDDIFASVTVKDAIACVLNPDEALFYVGEGIVSDVERLELMFELNHELFTRKDAEWMGNNGITVADYCSHPYAEGGYEDPKVVNWAISTGVLHHDVMGPAITDEEEMEEFEERFLDEFNYKLSDLDKKLIVQLGLGENDIDWSGTELQSETTFTPRRWYDIEEWAMTPHIGLLPQS